MYIPLILTYITYIVDIKNWKLNLNFILKLKALHTFYTLHSFIALHTVHKLHQFKKWNENLNLKYKFEYITYINKSGI